MSPKCVLFKIQTIYKTTSSGSGHTFIIVSVFMYVEEYCFNYFPTQLRTYFDIDKTPASRYIDTNSYVYDCAPLPSCS